MRSISPPPPRLRPAQRNQAITPSRQTPRRDQPTDTSAATSTDGVCRPVQPTDTASIGAEGIYRYPPELPPAGPAPRWPRTGRKGGNHQMRGISPDSAPRDGPRLVRRLDQMILMLVRRSGMKNSTGAAR